MYRAFCRHTLQLQFRHFAHYKHAAANQDQIIRMRSLFRGLQCIWYVGVMVTVKSVTYAFAASSSSGNALGICARVK